MHGAATSVFAAPEDRAARNATVPPPPLKRSSARLVHRARVPDQRFLVRLNARRRGISGLFSGIHPPFAYAAICRWCRAPGPYAAVCGRVFGRPALCPTAGALRPAPSGTPAVSVVPTTRVVSQLSGQSGDHEASRRRVSPRRDERRADEVVTRLRMTVVIHAYLGLRQDWPGWGISAWTSPRAITRPF